MISADCQAVRLELGAYVLGALDAAERAQVDTHLQGCPECSRELARLAPLPGLLAGAPAAELSSGLDDEPQGAERVLAELAQIRRRRRRLASVIAAACVVVALGGFGLTQAVEPGGARATVISATNSSTHVSGRVSLVATPDGSHLGIALAGVRPGTRCELVVIGAGGRREVAATWRANYDGTATVTGATAMMPPQITQMTVVAQPGPALLVLPGTAGPDVS